MSPRLAKLARASVVALLALGCTAGSEPPREVEAPDPDGPAEVVPLQATVALRLSGAEDLAFEGPAPLLVTRIRRDDVPRSGWFLAVGVQPPIELGEGRQLLFSVTLRPGKWEGNGEYTLDTQASDVEGEEIASPFEDAVVIELREVTDALDRTVYDVLPEACRAEIARDGFEGTVTCPSTQSEGGTQIAAEIEWTGTPAPTPARSRTRSPAP